MRTHHVIPTLAAAAALLTASWLPTPADARGFTAPDAPQIEFTEDIDEASLLTVRNGIALSGLMRAYLADSARTVTIITDDAVVYEVSFDDDGEYTQVLNHDGIPGAEWEVAAAVNEFDRDTGWEAVLAGDQGPHVELELDIEGRIAGEIIGIVDVTGGATGLEMMMVVDPVAIGYDLSWIIQVVLPEILQGDCSPDGYVGEMCDLLGDKTGCACLDMKDPETGDSTLDSLCDENDPDPFDPLYDHGEEAQTEETDESQEQVEETAEYKNRQKATEGEDPKVDTGEDDEENDEDDEEDDSLTDADGIAPWTEGPMFLVDNLSVLVVTQIQFETQLETDLHQQAQ